MYQILDGVGQRRVVQVGKKGELVQLKSWQNLCNVVFPEWDTKSRMVVR